MANIQSQMKRNRQNEVRRLRNRALRSELKTHARTALEAAQSGDKDGAVEALRVAQKRLDVAVSKGHLARNTAARRKSRLAKQVNSLLG